MSLEKVTERVNDIAQGLVKTETNLDHHVSDSERRFDNIEQDIETIADQIVKINEGNIELQSSGKAVIKTLTVLATIVTTLIGIAFTWITMQIT